MGEWMSKGPADGQGAMTAYTLRAERHSQQTAHIIADGRPACASLTKLDGTTPMLAPFKCSWVALHPYDKKCGYCGRIERGAAHMPRAVALSGSKSQFMRAPRFRRF